jgi:hypothetical protein
MSAGSHFIKSFTLRETAKARRPMATRFGAFG